MKKVWLEYEKGYFVRWDQEANCFVCMHPTEKTYSQGTTVEQSLKAAKDAVRLIKKHKK